MKGIKKDPPLRSVRKSGVLFTVFSKRSLFWLFLGLAFSRCLHGQTAKKSLEIHQLSGDSYVFTSYGMSNGVAFPSNGMYVVTNEGVFLIDTPWDTTQFQPLLDSIEARHHQRVVLAIATHSHEDRTGGLAFLRRGGIKTYTSTQTDEISRDVNGKRAEFLFEKDTLFRLGQHSFRTFYPGEGHTKDNIVVWCEKDKVLYGGCLIKSTEAGDLGYTREANMKAWPATIQRVKQEFRNASFVIPGHQGWSNIKSLDHTLHLLEQAQNKN